MKSYRPRFNTRKNNKKNYVKDNKVVSETSQLQQLRKELIVLQDYQYGEHPSRILFVSNLPNGMPENDVTKFFNQYGDVKKIYFDTRNDGFIFVFYYDIRSARKALKYSNLRTIEQNTLHVTFAIARDVLSDYDQNQGTLVIFNIDARATNENVCTLFKKYGDVKEIRETPNKKHHRFIEFYDLRDAQNALRSLNHTSFFGKSLKIEPSRPGGVRQRLLTIAIKALKLPEEMPALPPPEDVIILLDKFEQTIEATEKSNEQQISNDNESLIISLPKPTAIGEELSQSYINGKIGTPHNNNQGFIENTTTDLTNEGKTTNNDNGDDDENKTVMIIENIPNTVCIYDIIEKIQKRLLIFMTNFSLLKMILKIVIKLLFELRMKW